MSNRSKGHARHSRTCKCGRTIRGNAWTKHVRTCPIFRALYLDYAPDVLRRYGVKVTPE